MIPFLNKTASGHDFRLKMIAQYHLKKPVVSISPASDGNSDDNDDTLAAWRFAEACTWSPGDEVWQGRNSSAPIAKWLDTWIWLFRLS